MSASYAKYVLVLMAAINFVNYVDRFMFPGAASAIQDEFQMSDAQVGNVATAFTLIYAVAALPFGYWADRGSRRQVIGIGVTIWSVATLLTGFARGFVHLLFARAVLGVGEASYYPAGTSLLSDYFGKERRGRMNAIWSAGSVFGIAVGFSAGGIIAARFGWRYAFFASAIPGLLLAILAFTMREPPRGSTEENGPLLRTATEAGWSGWRRLISIPTVKATIGSQLLLYWVLGALAVFLPLYVHRRFGLGVASASTLAGGVLVVGGLAGTLLGGYLADLRAARSPRAHLEVGLVGTVGGAVFVALSFAFTSVTLWVVPALIATTCLYLYSAPYTAVQQNVVVPSLRASVVMATLLIAHLFGDSWSPSAIGWLSDSLHDLGTALLLTTPTVLILAAAIAALGLKHVARDVEAMEADWSGRRRAMVQTPPG